MKKQVGLSEDWLYGIVKESINGVISESGRSSYTQKKYNAATRNEIISNAQSEVDKLRAEISNLTKKIRVAQSPEAIEQLKRQRNILYNLRNRAVAKVWNLSNERVMTAAAKERATNRYREKIAKEKNKIRFTPEDVPTFMESKNMNKKMVRLTESDLHKIVKESVNKILREGYYEDMYLDDDDEKTCPYCGSDNVDGIIGKKGYYKCYDCGEEFDIDSAYGNNWWEPDWDAMRHESHKRSGKVLK